MGWAIGRFSGIRGGSGRFEWAGILVSPSGLDKGGLVTSTLGCKLRSKRKERDWQAGYR